MVSRLTLAMAALVELVVLALLGQLEIDKTISSCAFKLAARSASDPAFLVADGGPERCDDKARRIFVYDLPEKFNAALLRSCDTLDPWKSMCSAVSNWALGPTLFSTDDSSNWWLARAWRALSLAGDPDRDRDRWPAWRSWHATEQFTGDVFFHRRMLDHRCRTLDPDEASAFYIPFYAGLDVSRHLWATNATATDLDSLGEELLAWLQLQPRFNRRGGADHFLMAGRISWDFRRMPSASDWGSSLFHRSEMQPIKRLVVERSPWDESELGVPYPTNFHPQSDAELAQWLQFVKNSPRPHLFAFAGSPRPGYRTGRRADFRAILHEQCRAVPPGTAQCIDCKLDTSGCTADPLRITKLFLSSVFCLQPRGDSFTRKSIFDSLIAGCIPVLFWNQSAYWQYQLYLPPDPATYSVFIAHESVRSGTKIVDVLAGISKERIERMRRTVLEIAPRLLYAASTPGRHWADAVDVAIEGVMEKILAAS